MSAASNASRPGRERRNRAERQQYETDDRAADGYGADDDAEDAHGTEDLDDYEDVDDDDEDTDDHDVRAGSGGLSAAGAVEAGVRQLAQFTGRQILGVTGLDRTADGWVVEVEVVEDRRVPSSSDILGLYRGELDTDGSVVGYRRTRRYPRGRGDGREER